MSIPDVRVAIAFGSDPGATDAWTDVTPYVDLGAGLKYGRGRADERSLTTARTVSMVLDNRDGRLTAGSTKSPYYPNVRIGKRLRVSARVGTGTGNLLVAEDASFEGGTTGTWGITYFGSPAAVTLSNSTSHPTHGSRGLLITWPTAAAGCSPQLFVNVVKGRTYTARAVVWIPAGSPAVRFGSIFGTGNVDSSTTGAFQTLTTTFVADSAGMYLGFRTLSATTAGQQCFVDAIQVDEASSLGTFTTSPPPQTDRYTGYITELPAAFPGGNVAEVRLTASDRIGYFDARNEMRSAPAEAILATGPLAYWPLTDAKGAGSAGEISGYGQPELQVASYGPGLGVVDFGAGTGPATDSASATVFTPTSTSDGKFLSCQLTSGIGFYGLTVLGVVNTSTSAVQTTVRATDGYGWYVDLGVAADGKLTAVEYSPFSGVSWTLTSAASVANGGTRVVAVKVAFSGGTATRSLWVDGTQVASSSAPGSWMATATYVSVGGAATSGQLLTGTVSHVALWNTGNPDIAAISASILTGLGGQTINASLSQVATWGKVAVSDLVAETGLLTATAHRPTEGQNLAQVMLALGRDEGGMLFVDGSGRYVFQARDHRWQRPSVMTIDTAYLAKPDIDVEYDTQGLANDVTVKRPKGGTGQRVTNTESINALGPLDYSLEVAAQDDADLVGRAGWEANYRATPYPRITSLPIDLLTMSEADTLTAAALQVGDTVTVKTWPSQAQAQAFDLTIEGWTETISLTRWTIEANTSRSVGPPSSADAIGGQALFNLDDPVYGLIDAGIIMGY